MVGDVVLREEVAQEVGGMTTSANDGERLVVESEELAGDIYAFAASVVLDAVAAVDFALRKAVDPEAFFDHGVEGESEDFGGHGKVKVKGINQLAQR